MRGWFVYAIVGLFVAVAVYACCCGAPLTWDGAYQLNDTLIGQKPYVYLSRFHTRILWQPLVWISGYTSNQTAIYLAYGLPFLLAPAVGLLVSWWIVRRDAPWLIVWVIFGVAIGPLPGQIFVINDSIFQQHLFWPLFVSLFARVNWRQWIVLMSLAIFQFAHPIGTLLFFGIAGSGAVLSFLDRPRRTALLARSTVAALLGAAAVWKYRHFPDPYAAKEATWAAAMSCWAGGVQRYPIRGMMCMWSAGVLFFASASGGRLSLSRIRQLLVAAAFLFALIGAAIWIYWASDVHRWPWASEYRRWVVPLTLPFYILCWLEYVRRLPRRRSRIEADSSPEPTTPPTYRHYRTFSASLASVFAIVFTIQSTLFHTMLRRLLNDMRAFPGVIVPDTVVAWRASTPLQHWSLTDLAIAVQGKHPRQLLANPEWIRDLYGLDGRPPVFPNYTVYSSPPNPNSNGWYDIRPILEEMPKAPPF